ncbi:MAG: hypothetical protein STSR0004_16280 [Peptococcaceae bacterium]
MREVLEIKREAEYFTPEGLRTLTGLSQDKWDFAILKELLDNALDAVNELYQKEVIVETGEGCIAVYDSGPGLPEAVLDRIFDFNVYVSSKRDFRTPTRGLQGNALKTIIAICHLKEYNLLFFSDNIQYSYKTNKMKLMAGIVEFEKEKRCVSDAKNGIKVTGINLDNEKVMNTVWTYRLCNPDVAFRLNDIVYEAVTEPVKRADKTFIHWYDFAGFNQLMQAVARKEPQRTVKDFCLKFSGTQRILSNLTFPYKRLSEFDKKEEDIKALHLELKEKTQKPKPAILTNFLSGKETLFKVYGNTEDFKYRRVLGEYVSNEAVIPYALEGFLLQNNAEDTGCRIITAINCSVPYEKIPFKFDTWYEEFCGKEYQAGTLAGLLYASGFTEAQGITLFVNFASPYLEFTDKSKTNIIVTGQLKQDLLKLSEYLCKDTIKEVERAKRTKARFNRTRAIRPQREIAKKDLMFAYFDEALNKASGGYMVTARQIFYVLREIINTRHGKDLTDSDYNVFTQEVVTYQIEEKPDLENVILFERRGFFRDPFFSSELPLGTRDVYEFIQKNYTNEIYETKEKVYSLPPNLLYNHVLFIEKAGFNTILESSGLLRELNLGVMATQGFGTRAAKKLIEYFISNGIKVYVLHDCDIAGYLIQEKFESGSNTFKKELDVAEIGLTVEDVKELDKAHLAEVVSYKRSYRNSLDILTEEERNFFVASSYYNQYRRVEINALTSPELLDFIKAKIKYKPIKPTIDQLKNCITIDTKDIIKTALLKAYGTMHLEINKDEIARDVFQNINGNDHWVDTLDRVVSEKITAKIDEIVKRIHVSP